MLGHLRIFSVICLLLAQPVWAASNPQERALEQKLEAQLEALVGPGKAKVVVSGKQNNSSQTRSKQYSRPQVASQQTLSERDSSGRVRTETRTSWIHDQRETLGSTAAELGQKSVSVIYQPPQAAEGQEAPGLTSAQVEEMLSTAANLDPNQGDRIHVQAGHFSQSAFERIKAEMEKARQGSPWWVFALLAVVSLLLGAGLTALMLLRRRQKQQPVWPEPQALSGYPQTYLSQPQALLPAPTHGNESL